MNNIILLIVLTILVLIWVAFLFKASEDDFKEILYVLLRQNNAEQRKLLQQRKKIVADNNITKETTIDQIEKSVKKQLDLINKKLKKLKKENENIKNGNVSVVEIIPLMGYTVQKIKLFNLDASSNAFRNIRGKYKQIENDKDAIGDTKYLLAYLISFISLGFVVAVILSCIIVGSNMDTQNLLISLVVFAGLSYLGYKKYKQINENILMRSESIEADFPKIMSKLALLSGAGMSVDNAWKLTAYSGEGVLYDEMQSVVTSLEQNVPPHEAYGQFMINCNNKYTTKLAMSILQNTSKGNDKIITLFQNMNDESWFEKRQNAKQFGEKAGGKLLLPMILMFMGIMLLVIGPVVLQMNGI